MRSRLLVLGLALIAPAIFAQQAGSAPAPASDHELVLQLMQRVNALEAELARVKQAPATPASEGEVPPAVATTPQQRHASRSSQSPMDTMDDTHGLPGMHFQGFSDIGYRASDLHNDHNAFALGQFNLFITSKIGDKFGVLGEMVLESDLQNAYGVELERLLFQYSANDYFHLNAGRYHSAIGFYNTAYHHATWLQTTVDRPFLFAFEDDGGVLPIHNVGVSASGLIPSGKLGLHYVAEIGNGRTSRSILDEPVQNRVDENNGKAFNFEVFARPDSIRGLQVGASAYHDKLHPAGAAAVGQTILNGHVIYQAHGLEFMNEVLVMRQAVEGGRVFHIPAFYSQISKQFGKYRPYFRYEYLNVPNAEPLFGDAGLRHGPLGGIRYDFTEFAAFKLEYDRTMRRQLSTINQIQSQVSFTF